MRAPIHQRHASINDAFVTLYLLVGVAEDNDGARGRTPDAAKDPGRFWLLHDDGQRSEIQVMRNLFTPRFGQPVWVLLYRGGNSGAVYRYALAGHVGSDDAVFIALRTIWHPTTYLRRRRAKKILEAARERLHEQARRLLRQAELPAPPVNKGLRQTRDQAKTA